MKNKIDLGVMRPDYGSVEPVAASSDKDLPKKKVYPSIYISDLEDEPDIPDSGEAVIRYKVIEKCETERDGKKTCSYDIEIHEMSPTSKSSSSSKDSDSDDEIERGLSRAESEKED